MPWIVSLGMVALVLLALDLPLVLAAAVGITSGEGITDWAAFYAAGTIVRWGDGAHLYDLATQDAAQERLFAAGRVENAFPMPAFVAVALAPLTTLSFAWSYVVWLAVNVFTLGALILVAHRYLAKVTTGVRVSFLTCAALSIPAAMVLLQGQFDLLILSAVLLSYALLRRGHENLAGTVLALGLVKPQIILAPVALLVIDGRRGAVMSFGLAAATLMITPALAFGPGIIADQLDLYRTYLGASPGHAVNAALMINLRGAAISITRSSSFFVWAPTMIAVSAVAWVMAIAVWRRESASSPQSWAVALCLPLLYSPHLHIQSAVFLVAAAAFYLRASGGTLDPIPYTRVLLSFITLTVLWLWSFAGLSLVGVLTVAAYAGFTLRWPEDQVAR